MSSSEIRQYIQQLAEHETSKLKITSAVMKKFGTQYHYSFKEWGNIVSDVLATYQSSLKTSPVINLEELDIISFSCLEENEIKWTATSLKRTSKEEATLQLTETEKINISRIDYSLLEKDGIYKITFSDAYVISGALLKNIFLRILQHIGFIRVKELEITIKEMPLISYVHDNPSSYEKYTAYSSYYIYKLKEREILEVSYEIIKRTNTAAILEKNNNIIFQSHINAKESIFIEKSNSTKEVEKARLNNIQRSEEKERSTSVISIHDTTVVGYPKSSKEDKTKNLDLSKFKHKDLLPFSTEEKAVCRTVSEKLEAKENIIQSPQATNKLSTDDRLYNFKELSIYVAMIRHVRIRSIKSDAAPHKPIFLLTLIELIAEGYVEENRFMLDKIMRHVFDRMWIKHNPNDNFKAKIEYPFVYLASNSIWELVLFKENDIPKPTNVDIYRKVRYGTLDQKFFNLLKISDNRSFMKDFIIKYFNLKP